jgi:predicted HTH domain antitoxin
MSDTSLTLTLPNTLVEELAGLQQEFLIELLRRGLRELKVDRALDLYARGDVSFAAAAERAGVSRSELARHAYARGLEPPFSTLTVAEELA